MTMTAVKLHRRRTRSNVWVVYVSGLFRVPALSRILADLHPVVFAILYVACVLESLGKELAEVIVVGSVFEAEVSNIRQILVELFWEALAEILNSGSLLLLADLLVLLLVRGSLESLPRQTTAQEIHENVTKGFQVIPSGLLAAKMCVDAHVTSSTGERFAFTVWNVLLGSWIPVLLGHTKIDNMDDIGGLGARAANEEVIGLDITVDQVTFVNGLYARQHLLGDHDNGLDRETTSTVVKKVLKGRP